MSRYVVFLLMFCAALGAVAGNLVPENGSFEKWNGNAPAGFSINTVFKNWQEKESAPCRNKRQSQLRRANEAQVLWLC